MSRSYYDASREELIKRIDYLQKCNYVDFFRDSDAFILALCIAYFGLTEDIMIQKDSKNNDIKTRLSTCIDEKYLNQLLDGDTGIDIRVREVDGTSPEWFLSALRNGIFHQGPDVDYDEKTVTVDNDGPMNRLDCTVPFNWFKNYALEDLMYKLKVDEYNYTTFFNPFKKADECKRMENNDDIVDFIENELIGYSLKFKRDEKHSNKNQAERYDLINYCNKMTQTYWKYLFDTERLDEKELVILNEYKKIIESRLVEQKKNLDDDSYNRLLSDTLFATWFEAGFKHEFPNYIVSISNFDRNDPAFNLVVHGFGKDKDGLSKSGKVDKRLFNTAKKREIFYRYTHPAFQRMDVTSQLSSLVNYDKVDYVNAMKYLFEMYMMHKDFVVDDYNLTGFMREILRTNRVPNHMEIEERYAKTIDSEMRKEGLDLCYDKQIAEDLIRQKDSSHSDIHLRCREICGEYENYYSDECLLDVMGLKREFLEYFNQETLRREARGDYSDQVLEKYDERNLYRLCNAKGVMIQQRDEMLIALLYTLGINTYVVNMETHYKKQLSEADYSFMDSLYFEGYSRKAITKKEEANLQLPNFDKRISELDKKISDISVGLESADEVSKKKRIALKEGWEKAKEKEKKEKQEKVDFINYTTERNFAGSSEVFGKAVNDDCATIIRNCFAHGGRIFVESHEAGGDSNIILTDFDEDGNLSGIVRTNASSLIKYFSHPVFRRVMDSVPVKSSVVGKSK